MTDFPDPFIHHPVLRSRIIDPHASSFRGFEPSDLDAQMKAQGMPDNWRYSDEKREALRRQALARHSGDLWVFAYGSLMWNPAFLFAEVRHGRVDGYERAFCLFDTRGGRGTADKPGLMAALDVGDRCDGLAFRIAADLVEAETAILFKREMLMGSYVPTMVPVATGFGTVDALTFVANPAAKTIRRDIARDDQVRFIATGTGRLGSSLEYLANLADHFQALGIDDPHVFGLLDEVRAYRATHGLADEGPAAT